LEMSVDVLVQAADAIPPEWYESDRSRLDELIERLDKRRSRIREMVSSVCNSSAGIFPNWH